MNRNRYAASVLVYFYICEYERNNIMQNKKWDNVNYTEARTLQIRC